MRASNLSGKPLAHEKKNQPIPLREIGRSRFVNDAHDLKASLPIEDWREGFGGDSGIR